MKFATIATIAVASANPHPQVEGMMDWMPAMPTLPSMGSEVSIKADPKLQSDAKWYVEGMKGYYDGYYKQFYKKREDASMSTCLDETTTQNMVTWGTIMLHPSFLTDNIFNFSNDFTLATEGMQVMEDVMACHFEKSAYDLMTFCSADATACTMSKLLENLSKNMFVIMGKMTSMAETMKDFPAEDRRDFKEQCEELGGGFGTFFRVLFNFQSKKI